MGALLVLFMGLFARESLAQGKSAALKEYSGIYTSSYQESIFVPCEVSGASDGWWLRFGNPVAARFLEYKDAGPGSPPVRHFIRVLGSLGPTGRYGLGFHSRELTVTRTLEIRETTDGCTTFDLLPKPWPGIGHLNGSVFGATTNTDGGLAAVVDQERIVSVWNTRDGSLIKEFASEDSGSISIFGKNGVPIAFSRDSKLLAVGGADGLTRVWDPATGRRLWELAQSSGRATVMVNGREWIRGNTFPISSVAFDQSGSFLAVGGFPGAVWSMTSGEQLAQFGKGERLVFLKDGTLLVGADSGLVRIYPSPTSKPVFVIGTRVGSFQQMKLSADERWLAFQGWGDSLNLWSIPQGRFVHKFSIPGFSGGGVAFSPDGNTIAVGGGSYGIYLWDTRTGLPIRSFHNFPLWPRNMWFTPDGGSIVASTWNDTLFRIVTLPSRIGDTEYTAANGPDVVRYPRLPPPAGPGTFRNSTQKLQGSVTGSVVDTAGKPIENARISVYAANPARSSPVRSGYSREHGRFFITGFAMPHVYIVVRREGYETVTLPRHIHHGYNSLGVVMRPTKPPTKKSRRTSPQPLAAPPKAPGR